MDTRSEEDEPIFLFRMIRVSYKPREIIRKGSFGFLKRDIMFLAVRGILMRIPVKGKMSHELHCSYTVIAVKVQNP